MSLLVGLWWPAGLAVAQIPTPANTRSDAVEAEILLAQMSVAERVGQLFLVTFQGEMIRPDTAIADLILNEKVGGVVLLASNGNISSEADAPGRVAALTNQLQQIALLGQSAFITQTVASDIPPSPTPDPGGVRLPLLIAIQQEGNGPPYDQILQGLTQVPNEMAIGATWQPDYARQVGQIVGQELAGLGINLLLGPSLDVLENPVSGNRLGTRTFGGDPYWVGQMGRAYVAGVHVGSSGRIAVIANHFPGYGSSDRPLGEEVATVRKSLDELKQVELVPFMAVTNPAGDEQSLTDGLMTTHIRYQGFQGNIRATTAPISFDSQALLTLLQLPEFVTWRNNGGLIMSDELGSRAVQRFYDDTGQSFPHRRVAKDALQAGNDLLYLNHFALPPTGYETELANIKDTIAWFREKYGTDPAFQQRVDEAVKRILQLKLRLYEQNFRLNNVSVEVANAGPESNSQHQANLLNLAKDAITLISPSPNELLERMPSPPGPEDHIVIFTDSRTNQPCANCPAGAYIRPTSLEEHILALYGPEGSDQVTFNRVNSFSFDELLAFLTSGSGPPPTTTPLPTATLTPDPEATATPPDLTPTPTTPPSPTATPSPAQRIQTALASADWIIFAILDVRPELPTSNVLSNFLAQRPDLVRNSKVVVFAYDAPYYLDTTEISILTAFYGVYSKTESFIGASVRALFQEFLLSGASPVNIASTGYNLLTITQPDPRQIIELFIFQNETAQSPPSNQPLETIVGETLRLQTGVIRDYNGHPVPDGTPVQFMLQDRISGLVSRIGEQPTKNGVAQFDYVLEARTGQFQITATAGDARNSQQVNIDTGENVRVVIITPTPAPSPLPTHIPTPTPSPTPTPTLRPTSTPTLSPTPIPPTQEPRLEITLADFRFLSGLLLGLLLVGGIGFVLLQVNHQTSLAKQIQLISWGFAGGLLFYNYLILGLPGSHLLQGTGSWASLIAVLIGGGLGFSAQKWRK